MALALLLIRGLPRKVMTEISVWVQTTSLSCYCEVRETDGRDAKFQNSSADRDFVGRNFEHGVKDVDDVYFSFGGWCYLFLGAISHVGSRTLTLQSSYTPSSSRNQIVFLAWKAFQKRLVQSLLGQEYHLAGPTPIILLEIVAIASAVSIRSSFEVSNS